jgi:hypothetical protein
MDIHHIYEVFFLLRCIHMTFPYVTETVRVLGGPSEKSFTTPWWSTPSTFLQMNETSPYFSK